MEILRLSEFTPFTGVNSDTTTGLVSHRLLYPFVTKMCNFLSLIIVVHTEKTQVKKSIDRAKKYENVSKIRPTSCMFRSPCAPPPLEISLKTKSLKKSWAEFIIRNLLKLLWKIMTFLRQNLKMFLLKDL